MMRPEELIKNLTLKEKCRIFSGDGPWNTFSAGDKVPSFSMADGPHGLRKQGDAAYADMENSHIATCYPTASALASSWNTETIEKLAKALATEAYNEDVQVLLGCGMNIKRSPLCGRNFEYFSEDPYLAGTLAAQYVKTIQENGVAACPKHFCANNQEKRRMTSNSIVDERTLNEIYLRAFEIVVKNSAPKSIMASYNRCNGSYVGHNKKFLTDILRTKWGYKGIVISDWGACINAADSMMAGMDLAMPDSNGYLNEQLEKAVAAGKITEADVEKMAARVVGLAQEMKNQNREKGKTDLEAHNKIAVDLAADCAVLLKNEGLLPLKQKEICVIGELAEFLKFQGGGSSHIQTRKTPNVIEALEAKGFKVEYSKGYLSGFVKRAHAESKNKPYQKKALELAKQCAEKNMPIVFCCGLTDSFEGEGFDREDLLLPPEQLKLLDDISKITKNIVVLTFAGAPIDFSFTDKVNAILHMHYAGQGVGEAAAILVSGERSPSGKLSESYPFKVEDTPCFGNFSITGKDDIYYKEGLMVGYRYYQTKNIPVRYEFGYGLSYSTFEYSNFSVEKSGDSAVAKFTLKNTGNVDAAEVAQIYVKNPENKSGLQRAIQELRGYAKVFLKAGESKEVTIKLDDNAFKVFSTKKEDFVLCGGEYTVQLAASVKDIKSEKVIKIEGESLEALCDPIVYTDDMTVEGKLDHFVMSSSLGDMSKKSFIIRAFLAIILIVLRLMNKGQSADSPIVKIQINTIRECPVESLISTSGGSVNHAMARFFVWCANHRL
ncbi:MAG: glycoside hydrolase family 3 N-terminal domain-containing protein [Treponemataceae bacterium]|nr:glycoside hydrolase family 3 N-terminal domain-containing protein [Spirochaetales bacterium]MDY6030524.1 glycoside hydrolase family 3 N-terminal domain-containing protein [Treponemataceae bacterium]